MPNSPGPLLRVSHVSIRYGRVRAVDGISLQVCGGESVAIIGPNGAGKSTTLKGICGLVPISDGTIWFRDTDITGLPPHKLVQYGIGLAPEERHVFPTMSVLENLEMGGFSIGRGVDTRQRMQKLLQKFPLLDKRRRQKARSLSGGEQQLLSMARALMLDPVLFLLDEPTFALSPNFVRIVFNVLGELREQGTSMLVVEQNAREALEATNRAYVFQIGGIALSGDSQELLRDARVQTAFLGEGH